MTKPKHPPDSLVGILLAADAAEQPQPRPDQRANRDSTIQRAAGVMLYPHGELRMRLADGAHISIDLDEDQLLRLAGDALMAARAMRPPAAAFCHLCQGTGKVGDGRVTVIRPCPDCGGGGVQKGDTPA